jgi:hypothetical protein
MSTTLVPPSYYIVKPRGQAARQYLTVGQAAIALSWLAPTPTVIGVITGKRTRSLTDRELRELARHVRAHRQHAGRVLPLARGRRRTDRAERR